MNICGNCFNEYEGACCPNCGYSAASDTEKFTQALKPGSVLAGRYIVGRVLGEGGFGITYKAMDYETKQLVAIKEFMPSSIVFRNGQQQVTVHSRLQQADFERCKADFLSEARILSQFNSLKNICDIYSYFEENGTAYFAMEFVDGLPLNEYVKKLDSPLSFEEAKKILLPVMEALEHVHAQGIVHRDISPDNIIVRPNGQAVIIDFGAARYAAGEKTKSLTVVLKYGFAPMEQYSRRGHQGPHTDVYAMAATMYWLITGNVPPESVVRVDNDNIVPPSKLGFALSPGEEKVLMKALAVDSSKRFQNMGEFANALIKKKLPASPLPQSGKKRIIALACAAVLAVALICVLLIPKTGEDETMPALPSVPVSSEPWELKDGVLYINEPMGDFADSYSMPWRDLRPEIKEVWLADSVTSISDFAFYRCEQLSSIRIPDTLSFIGENAFCECVLLSEIHIPDSVSYIGQRAFYNCDALTEIRIPEGVSSIGEQTFYECKSLGSVELPESLLSIGTEAFSICHGLGQLRIPDSVNHIGDRAFQYCSNLKNVTLPNSLTEIGKEVFDTCDLEEIIIPDSVVTIGNSAFEGCSAVNRIVIPDSVETIELGAFAFCGSVSTLSLPASLTYVGMSAFQDCTFEEIYYSGTRAQWDAIRFGSYNESVTNAATHFES